MNERKMIKILFFFFISFLLLPTQVLALEPCPDPLNVTECCLMYENTGYLLGTDIKANGDCFVINGTYIDCRGHTITGDGSGIAINISNRNYVFVINCSINNFTTGINVESNANKAVIKWNKIFDNERGILFNANPNLPPSYGSIIRNNVIIDNLFGIHIRKSKENKIYNNYFANNYYHAYDDSGYENYWNTTNTEETNIIGGPYIGGNYWDDYDGEDLDGDGLGDTDLPYRSNGWILIGGDYLPLVDISPPRYSNITLSNSSPTTYTLNITWKDNLKVDKVLIELDGINYTDLQKIDETRTLTPTKTEHSVTYSKTFENLKEGTHRYRWYANDTSGNWNSTQLLSFAVIKPWELFKVLVVDETFCVNITDPQTLDLAYKDSRGEIRRIVAGNLSGGDGGFNQPWSWHLVPESVRLVEAAMEICDGKPSHVENNLDYWLNEVGIYCPWASDIISIGCAEDSFTSTTTVPTECIGPVQLSLNPNPVWASKKVTATISGLVNCDGKEAYVRVGRYKILRCSCTVSGEGCSCSFSAPNPLTNGTTYTHYAQVDLNDDGTIEEGEEDSEVLTVLCQAEGEACDSERTCCAGYYCFKGTCKKAGGCPILKAWNGEEFKEIEKLNIHSEEGIDTTYSTSFKMKPFEKNVYKIILEEKWYLLWEGSHVDEVSLKDSEGKECKLIKAIHSRLGDVTSLIEESDDERVEIKPGENVTLTFTGCSGNDFILSIEGYNPWWRFVKLGLSMENLPLLIVSILIAIVVMFGVFKLFRTTIRES